MDTEATNRTNADKRMTFVSIGEAEGLLIVNDYPFAFGFGSPSKAGFGLAIPFNFAIVGFAITVDSTDINRSITFSVEHYDVNGNLFTPQYSVTGSLGMSNVYNTNLFTELELELIQTQMAQKPMLRAEVGMRVRCANKASAE